MNLVIDTNVLMSAVIKDSITRKLIIGAKINILFPEQIFKELKNNEEEILKKSKLTKSEYNELLNRLLTYVKIIPTETLNPYKEKALEISKTIDINDTLFFATALAFKDSIIWSNDKKLKDQDKIKVMNTLEIKKLFSI